MGQFDSFKGKNNLISNPFSSNIIPIPTPISPLPPPHPRMSITNYRGLYVNNVYIPYKGHQSVKLIIDKTFKASNGVPNYINPIEMNNLVYFVKNYQFNTLTFYDIDDVLTDAQSDSNLIVALSYVFITIKAICPKMNPSCTPIKNIVILNSNYLNDVKLINSKYASNIDYICSLFGNLIDGFNLECEYMNSRTDEGCKNFSVWSQNFPYIQSKIHSYNKIFEAYINSIHDSATDQAKVMINYLDRVLFAVYPSEGYFLDKYGTRCDGNSAYKFQKDLSNFFPYCGWQFFTAFGGANLSFKFISIFQTVDFTDYEKCYLPNPTPDYFKNNNTVKVFNKFYSDYFNYDYNSWKNKGWGDKKKFILSGYQWFKYTDLYWSIYMSGKKSDKFQNFSSFRQVNI